MPNDRSPRKPDFTRDAREDGSDIGRVTPGAITDIGGQPDKTVPPGALTDQAKPGVAVPPNAITDGGEIVGGDTDRDAL
jgi:hypothetical protein